MHKFLEFFLSFLYFFFSSFSSVFLLFILSYLFSFSLSFFLLLYFFLFLSFSLSLSFFLFFSCLSFFLSFLFCLSFLSFFSFLCFFQNKFSHAHPFSHNGQKKKDWEGEYRSTEKKTDMCSSSSFYDIAFSLFLSIPSLSPALLIHKPLTWKTVCLLVYKKQSQREMLKLFGLLSRWERKRVRE